MPIVILVVFLAALRILGFNVIAAVIKACELLKEGWQKGVAEYDAAHEAERQPSARLSSRDRFEEFLNTPQYRNKR